MDAQIFPFHRLLYTGPSRRPRPFPLPLPYGTIPGFDRLRRPGRRSNLADTADTEKSQGTVVQGVPTVGDNQLAGG